MTNWYRKNQFEQQLLEEDKHYSCPVTAVTVESIVKVKSRIEEDTRVTHEEIQDAQGILLGSVSSFLRYQLSV